MTAAPKVEAPCEVALREGGGKADPFKAWRRPMFLWEETGRSTMGTHRGMGPDTERKICGDNTGKVRCPAGTGDNLQRPIDEARAEGEGRISVWRMSP
jgi:hypothetical protein